LTPAVALAGDQETADAIAKRFEASGQMKGYSVGVKVENGTAWLGGRVANQEQMVTAVSIAKSTAGIDRVVNNLTIVQAPASRKLAGSLHQPGGVADGSEQQAPAPQNPTASQGPVGKPIVRGPVVRTSAEFDEIASPTEVQFAAPASGEELDMYSRLEAQEQGFAAPGVAENASTPMAVRQPLPLAVNEVSSQTVQEQPAPRELARQQSSRQPAPMPMNARSSRQMGAMPTRQPMPLAMNDQMYGPGPGPNMAMMGPEAVGTPRPMPMHVPGGPGAVAPYQYDHPATPGQAMPPTRTTPR
jgi:hypothetical protein